MIRVLAVFLTLITFYTGTVFANTNNSGDSLTNDSVIDAKLWKNDLRSLFLNNNSIIYVLNIRTFNANDLDGNGIIETEKGEESGNFINAIDRLDELAGYGINTIHLLPITPIGKTKALGTAGCLYALNGFDRLNSQLDKKNNGLNVEQEAKLFIEQCHKRNIRVIVDLPSCGSYDYYLTRPELFVSDANKQPVIPADWLDVRLFKTQEKDGSSNEDLFDEHKKFVDLMLELGIDGIRADVATIKPYMFWKKLIEYTREKNPEFLFLAEASAAWGKPPSKYCVFTTYDKLLDAGFDGYYGAYFNFKDYKSANELEKQILFDKNLSKKFNGKTSVIGSFITHDESSPIIRGGKNFSSMVMWLNVTLPLNPYFLDGIQTGDRYIYDYSNKKAPVSWTDDDYYYVHEGKIDIFNFSRRPQGPYPELLKDFNQSIAFKKSHSDIISKGSFKLLKTNNQDVFAFERTLNKYCIIVILNKNIATSQSAIIQLNPQLNVFNNEAEIKSVRIKSPYEINKNTLKTTLEPSEIMVLILD